MERGRLEDIWVLDVKSMTRDVPNPKAGIFVLGDHPVRILYPSYCEPPTGDELCNDPRFLLGWKVIVFCPRIRKVHNLS